LGHCALLGLAIAGARRPDARVAGNDRTRRSRHDPSADPKPIPVPWRPRQDDRTIASSRHPNHVDRHNLGQPAAISAKPPDMVVPHLSCAPFNRRIAQLSDGSLISIIDDDESVRTATTALMRSLGHVAHSFASAQAFLQSADVDHSSCLIVDVQMPRMSGVELQSALLSQSRRIPIIFMTAYPERIRSRVLRSGAVCCISKPFRAQALIECIDRALKRHASHHGCKHARL
jgi:CheY-like chemotaxis protein